MAGKPWSNTKILIVTLLVISPLLVPLAFIFLIPAWVHFELSVRRLFRDEVPVRVTLTVEAEGEAQNIERVLECREDWRTDLGCLWCRYWRLDRPRLHHLLPSGGTLLVTMPGICAPLMEEGAVPTDDDRYLPHLQWVDDLDRPTMIEFYTSGADARYRHHGPNQHVWPQSLVVNYELPGDGKATLSDPAEMGKMLWFHPAVIQRGNPDKPIMHQFRAMNARIIGEDLWRGVSDIAAALDNIDGFVNVDTIDRQLSIEIIREFQRSSFPPPPPGTPPELAKRKYHVPMRIIPFRFTSDRRWVLDEARMGTEVAYSYDRFRWKNVSALAQKRRRDEKWGTCGNNGELPVLSNGVFMNGAMIHDGCGPTPEVFFDSERSRIVFLEDYVRLEVYED